MSQGKQLSERLMSYAEQFNQQHKVQIINVEITPHLFSKDIKFDLVEKNTNTKSDVKLLSAKYQLSYNPISRLFNRYTATLSGDAHVYGLTPIRQLAWNNFFSFSALNTYTINSLISENAKETQFKTNINFYSDDSIDAEFDFENLADVLNKNRIKADRVYVNYQTESEQNSSKITITIPEFIVNHGNKEISNLLDNEIDKSKSDLSTTSENFNTSVAKVIKPITPKLKEMLKIEEGTFTLNFDNSVLKTIAFNAKSIVSHNLMLSGFTSKIEQIESIDAKNKVLANQSAIETRENVSSLPKIDAPKHIGVKNNIHTQNKLANHQYKIHMKSDTVTYMEGLLGKFIADFELININSKNLFEMANRAHIRYQEDEVANRNTYGLPVYYFAQWLNLSEAVLTTSPQLKIHSLMLEKNDDAYLKLTKSWRFNSKKVDFNSINGRVFLLPFLYTDEFTLNIEITQPQLENLLELLLTLEEVDEKINKKELFFALNQMNQIFPFVTQKNITAEKNKVNQIDNSNNRKRNDHISKSDRVNFMDKESIFSIAVSYDHKKGSLKFNGKSYTQEEFNAFIKDIL
ncbi:hypothetical protein ACFFIT_07405 [Thorsellia kenyensis]|uniref:Uncharacterized protein n=2 Tax=Thorsellia kenyensis TaxID=1549888 RepID=A0ABV6CAB5_9GAMM